MSRWTHWFRPHVELPCPFCGQFAEIEFDERAGEHQTYSKPCPVCEHRQIVHLDLSIDAGGCVRVWLERGEQGEAREQGDLAP